MAHKAKASGHHGIRIEEYARVGWTFHGKGNDDSDLLCFDGSKCFIDDSASVGLYHLHALNIGMWCYAPGDTLPSATIVGSSNFGIRSLNRDMEAQVTILTSNRSLQERIHQVCVRLDDHLGGIDVRKCHDRFYVLPPKSLRHIFLYNNRILNF